MNDDTVSTLACDRLFTRPAGYGMASHSTTPCCFVPQESADETVDLRAGCSPFLGGGAVIMRPAMLYDPHLFSLSLTTVIVGIELQAVASPCACAVSGGVTWGDASSRLWVTPGVTEGMCWRWNVVGVVVDFADHRNARDNDAKENFFASGVSVCSFARLTGAALRREGIDRFIDGTRWPSSSMTVAFCTSPRCSVVPKMFRKLVRCSLVPCAARALPVCRSRLDVREWSIPIANMTSCRFAEARSSDP